ncbi:MAG: signal peptidase II [Massilia sp.]
MATKKKQLFSTARPASNNLLPWLGIALIVILLDQVTKITILRLFVWKQFKVITSFFNVGLWYNPGAAWSFLGDASGWQRYLFIGIAVGAVIFILYLLRRHSGQRQFCWALSLIMGGAIGNVIDRIMYGQVVDFLLFHLGESSFPAFNIADSAICIGAALFIHDELRRVKNQ